MYWPLLKTAETDRLNSSIKQKESWHIQPCHLSQLRVTISCGFWPFLHLSLNRKHLLAGRWCSSVWNIACCIWTRQVQCYSYAHTIHFRPGSNIPPKPYSQNGLCSSSSSNWILMSCQPHRVTSGQSKSGHKQILISKLFSHTYQLSVRSVYKTNHFANIKHTSAPVTYQQCKEGQ